MGFNRVFHKLLKPRLKVFSAQFRDRQSARRIAPDAIPQSAANRFSTFPAGSFAGGRFFPPFLPQTFHFNSTEFPLFKMKSEIQLSRIFSTKLKMKTLSDFMGIFPLSNRFNISTTTTIFFSSILFCFWNPTLSRNFPLVENAFSGGSDYTVSC